MNNKNELTSNKEETLDNEVDTVNEENLEQKENKETNDSGNSNEFREKIIKMFGIVIIALVVVLFVGFIISLFSHKKYTYADVEDVMKDAAIAYFKDNKNKLPKSSEIVEIDSNVLANNKYMKTLDKYLKNKECSGKVSVEKADGKSYSYTSKLSCSDYTTTKLYAEVTKSDNIVTDGYGLYKSNNEYVYRGSKVNNYVRFSDSDKLWRIVRVTSNNEIVLISEDKTKNSFSWDERYNSQYDNNYGINTYKNSSIFEVMKKLYSNTLNSDEENYYNNEETDILTDEEKTKIVKFNVCVGQRGNLDTTKDGSSECATVDSTKMSLLSVYDFMNASLDSNCNSTEKPDCQNYNYLVTNYNYWLANGSLENSSKVYRVTSYGYLQASYANIESYIRPVIHLSENTMLEKGKGTKSDPYVVR